MLAKIVHDPGLLFVNVSSFNCCTVIGKFYNSVVPELISAVCDLSDEAYEPTSISKVAALSSSLALSCETSEYLKVEKTLIIH